MVNTKAYQEIITILNSTKTTLVAVSKIKPAYDIQALYDLGQRDFGENYVQELVEKEALLPKDLHWHFIGHLQSNKVKYIAPFVHLIHGVDSIKLLEEINKQGQKNNRVIDCLLQMHIAKEESKFGFDETDLIRFGEYFDQKKEVLQHVSIRGLMGMASFSEDEALIRTEFKNLKQSFEVLKGSTFLLDPHFDTLSMGMSGDYPIAIAEGATMVRIGSLLFGRRS
ncbi:YggS family pyridoxal phosphate-dependent enzyme [Taibaiella sp. KBW10]|uniref:YggS family pyridoxal phosphate-dependent enzyme n=1 Tax=Taibaiella sp. KBW10 TaxID=2153357 RepID=UPI000F590BEF|nr:YggS family pyridoxal phosphate-dependent enzyme [Taibaiella sp. KBW10]RQO32507.1 YggS family pyridoxal phosphate-dependent enzyme [Taibaiella sp. KBW10]